MTEATIAPLTPDGVDAVAALAHVVWQATYPALISQAQIDTMLADRYAADRIRVQLDDPAHHWLTARLDHELAGFAHGYLDNDHCKLDKLYVAPARQRHGIGRALFEALRARVGTGVIRLQVNRGNSAAIAAYEHWGFRIREARVFDIGGGFVMDDYVMELGNE